MIADTKRSYFECCLICSNRANLVLNFVWCLMANDETVGLPNAPYVEGVILLYLVQCTAILLMMFSWFRSIISSYINPCVQCKSEAHVFMSIECCVICMKTDCKEPMITLSHNISARRRLYRTLCNVQPHLLCISLGHVRATSLKSLFAIFNEANFCIWFWSVIICHGADTSWLPTKVRSRHKEMCLVFAFVG